MEQGLELRKPKSVAQAAKTESVPVKAAGKRYVARETYAVKG